MQWHAMNSDKVKAVLKMNTCNNFGQFFFSAFVLSILTDFPLSYIKNAKILEGLVKENIHMPEPLSWTKLIHKGRKKISPQWDRSPQK